MGARNLLFLSGAFLICLNLPAFADNTEYLNNSPIIFLEPPEKLDQLAQNPAALDDSNRVTSVSQLSDVQPSDWAFTALQSLVERYGVISGYPDGTFKGNRSLSRYEFAAGLQAVMQKIDELLASASSQVVRREDLEQVQKLSEQFAGELSTLRGRVDNLENRTAEIQSQQFSTTTKLAGQVIFGIATGAGGKPPGNGEANTIFTQLTQLQLASSFTGKDVFRIGLTSGNSTDDSFGNPQAFNTNMARLSWQADYDNQVQLDSLEYRIAGFGDKVVFTFKPVGFSLSSVLSVNSPYANAGQGAISSFAGSTSLFRIGSLDAGVGFDWLMSDKMRLQFAYGTRNSNDNNQGVLSADHSALGVQLLYKPTASLITGLAYVNAYASDGQLDTGTGSGNADTSGGLNEPAQIHALNASMKWQVSDSLVLSLWGGAAVTDSVTSDAFAFSTTYQASVGLYDPFGRKGDLLGLIIGQPLKLNNGYLIANTDTGNSTHYEVFYRYLVNDNIAITPGFFIVTDPGHISRNNDIFVGVLRTTFNF
ncbi:carbohydrate porin [Sphaerospermopsis aphanizomenoides BCCUSP55]|uniref:iron uptake porin n=1 Tax=Sphaerospermopsis aphanizomenoides TaxID=459663 RepID=UPI001905A8EA|nr:iron uptake porin [Sphaerospermopsis aphanizomenoides]MBK1989609.1 carbohydrate porin [Sphaerospermopsis aphanizomenoides BCCUSP55]